LPNQQNKIKKGGDRKNMISQKYSEQEQNNLNEIEELLNKNSNYIIIGPGEKVVLRFLPERRIEEVEKTYNGQTVKKVRFIVIEPNSGSNQEKFFDVGRRSARLIIAKLKEGHTLLKIERIGSGKDTLYIPTEVTG
jgi:hypothetical protein